MSPCPKNATCQLTGFGEGEYKCVCPTGFTGKQCEKGTDMIKIYHDYWILFILFSSSIHPAIHLSGPSSLPLSLPSFTHFINEIHSVFTDIDECATRQHNCTMANNGVECENLPGSFQCVCKEGYFGNGTKCRSKLLTLNKCNLKNIYILSLSLNQNNVLYYTKRVCT